MFELSRLAAEGFNRSATLVRLTTSLNPWARIFDVYLMPLIEDPKVLMDRKGVENYRRCYRPEVQYESDGFMDHHEFPARHLFPNKDMKEEFPEWFGSQIRQRHVDNDKDPEVSTTSELFALACGPTWTPISINSCVVDGVRYVVHNRDERRTTQNSDICAPGPDEEMYYGQLQEILEFKYLLFKVDDPDIIHFDNSSDLPLSTSLNDLDNADLMSAECLPVPRGDGVLRTSPSTPRTQRLHGCFANREVTDKKGPVPIRFELRDKQTVMPLGDHAAHWSSYIGEVIRGVPLYYPSWLKVPKERKAALITDIGTQFDLRPHMESPDWTEINAGIQQHLQKAYNTNKAAFKAQHWVIDPTTGTYDVEKIRRARPEDITAEEWEKYIKFWNDPRNIARAAQNRQNRAKSTVISRQGSRSLARLRDEMRQSSGTQEYPSLIDTFFVAHTVNGEFLRDEDRRIYEEMRRLEATGTYTDDEINRLARRGKQRGHIPGVGRVLPARATAGPSTPASESTLNSLHKKVDFMMSLFKSDSKYSDMFSQFESGGASGSGGCGDDEESADDQEDEDEDGDGDS
ncbi:F-box domain containing protein [Tanacetum coccineum]